MNLPILSRIVLICMVLFPRQFQGGETPRVDSPQPGEHIQGQVIISGNTTISGYARTEVYFGYEDSSGWFLITVSDQPVRNGPIATWDTMTIIDGIYQLKIVVYLVDGSSVEAIVPGLVIANQVTMPSATYRATAALSITSSGQGNSTESPRIITATAFPGNPASVSETGLWIMILVIPFGVALCFLIGFIWKRIFSRGK